MKKQSNDVFFQFNAIIIFLILMMYAVSIFFGGHYTPGGGFVGGLLLSSAVIIIGIAFDTKTLKKMFPFDFKIITCVTTLFEKCDSKSRAFIRATKDINTSIMCFHNVFGY